MSLCHLCYNLPGARTATPGGVDSLGGDVVWLTHASRKWQQNELGLKNVNWDFPGGPVVKTSPSDVGSVGPPLVGEPRLRML